jgi:hypothetical protein
MMKTLEAINTALSHWEPTWLFLLIAFEALIGVPVNIIMLHILNKEYWYDKEWNERKAARRKRIIQAEITPSNEGEMK